MGVIVEPKKLRRPILMIINKEIIEILEKYSAMDRFIREFKYFTETYNDLCELFKNYERIKLDLERIGLQLAKLSNEIANLVNNLFKEVGSK